MTDGELREYKRKRDPKQTPEPFTSKGRRPKEPIFVVQRHDARRLHYDFRLERNGALASWAVPKGVPLEPGQRALAVHVEDHPLDYATFEGEIPKGNYGAGTVEIWDRGTYELVEEKRDGGLTVRLHGERLQGTWTLVPAHLDGNEKNWLLLRKRDDASAPVASGRVYKPMLATLADELKPGTRFVYEVFDLLELDGVPVLDLPLVERRERLEALLDKRVSTVQISGFFDDGDALLQAATEQGLEGVMAKRPASRYQEGKRTRDWVKVKTQGRQEFVICGWTRGQGKRSAGFGSLVLGTYRGGELHWVGNVGTGFDETTIEALLAKLEPLATETPPFRVVPKMPKVRKGDVRWVRPELVCEVRFAQWTHDGHLRAPVYVGLRDDKPAREVRREDPVEQTAGRVKLSNLDKVFFPAEGITKGDLLDYYRAVADTVVPHLRDRPFTMRRYPDGIEGKAFFQKDAPSHMPAWIPTFRAHVSTRESPSRKKWIEAPLVNDEDALLWMVNMGCVDLNTWYSRVDKPDRPDFVLFDLDPSPDVGFKETVEVALIVKSALDALGLVSFAKTSSAEGMHVLVPIERRYTFDDTREFSEIVASAIARVHRGLATTEWSKSKRRGVLIDSNQNGEGKTIASVYSVRPRPGAPVSTPLRWDEVNEKLDPLAFTMDVVLERIRKHGDLFAGVLSTRQRIDKALNALR